MWRTALLVSVVCLGCSSTIRGRSEPGRVAINREDASSKSHRRATSGPGLPAYITIADKRFHEPSGDGALDAGEEGGLVVTLANTGLGPGHISVRLTPLGSVEGLRIDRYIAAGVLEVGDSLALRVPIHAQDNTPDSRIQIRVEILDGQRIAVSPFTLQFETRRHVPPEFRLVVRDVDDGRFFPGNLPDGLLRAGELVKVVANVQNLGGLAEGVVVELVPRGQVQIYRSLQEEDIASGLSFQIGDMETGQEEDVPFYFATPPVLSSGSVEIGCRLIEETGKYSTEETLTFEIGKNLKAQEVLAIQRVVQVNEGFPLVVSSAIDIEEVPGSSKTRLESGIAIIFGVEEYKYTFNAEYKSRDATFFYKYCREVLGIPEQRILLRMDTDATKAEFDWVFEPKTTENHGWLKSRLRDKQEASATDVFVYLAGHGFPDLATGQPYLIPHDVRPEQATNGVALADIYRTLSEFDVRSVTVFVEACFSGATGYEKRGEDRLLALNMNPIFPTVEQPLIGSETVVFAATSGKTPSSNRDDLKHGVFTYFILKGLGGAADLNGDEAVTVAELFRYVEKQVPRKALEPPLDREQVPQLLPGIDQLGRRGERILVQY